MRFVKLGVLRACVGLGALLACGAAPATNTSGEPWASDFAADPAQLASTGRNPYFVLEPGHHIVLEEGASRMFVTVLDETKVIAGVETRVVEERETVKGQVTELSRNYVAIHKQTHDVLLFGEYVNNYKNGKVVNHTGSWTAGVGKAQVGLLLPGKPHVGYRYYQEQAPGVTTDRVEIVSMTIALKTPAGAYENCLRTEVSSPATPGEKEYRTYAPGIGLAKFESMLMVEHGLRDDSQPTKAGGGF
jgi:hypothetical protein